MNNAIQQSNVIRFNLDRPHELERGLRQAIANNFDGFSLHYQPQINLQIKSIIGAEALLRWSYKNESIPPSEFIPIAENAGLIVELGNWVLREACKRAFHWNATNLFNQSVFKISVNVSVLQLTDHFPKYVSETLLEARLSPDFLNIEVTESLQISNQQIIGILHILKSLGVSLSIDDFGTGFSCLSMLKNMPFDVIKIDKSFVDGLDQGCESSLSLIEAIVYLSRKHGMSTLAEGVESQNQCEMLTATGCDAVQGYYFSRALPVNEFERFMNTGI